MIDLHFINARPHFLISSNSITETIVLPFCGLFTLDGKKLNYFLDNLEYQPLWKATFRSEETKAAQLLLERMAFPIPPCEIKPSSIIHLAAATDGNNAEEQIVEVQKVPSLNKVLTDPSLKNTLNGIFTIVEILTTLTMWRKEKAPQRLVDSLKDECGCDCRHITALTAACLKAWDIPFRLCSGFGKNIKLPHIGEKINYFSDEILGYGPDGHCWLEIHTGSRLLYFDPTIYFNKFKNKVADSKTLRRLALQVDLPEPTLFEEIIPDYHLSSGNQFYRKTLLMFSGGIDSTALLKQLLTETEDIVHVHHIDLKDPFGRHDAELAAARKIIEYCKQRYRPFNYTESVFDYLSLGGYAEDDVYNVIFTASQIVKHDHRGDPFNRVVLAMLNPDEEEFFIRGAKKRAQEAEVLFKTLFNFGTRIETVPAFDLTCISGWGKKKAWDYIGPDLQRLVWYCRKPQQGQIPCGTCFACLHIQFFILYNQ